MRSVIVQRGGGRPYGSIRMVCCGVQWTLPRAHIVFGRAAARQGRTVAARQCLLHWQAGTEHGVQASAGNPLLISSVRGRVCQSTAAVQDTAKPSWAWPGMVSAYSAPANPSSPCTESHAALKFR